MRLHNDNLKSKAAIKRQQGFTLLEVMVALVIFSIGLLGLADLQIKSLDYNNGAYQRSQASFLISDIMDRMRANKGYALNGSYDVGLTQTVAQASCITASCSPTGLISADLYEWKQALKVLPGGEGSVVSATSGGVTTFTVTVVWNDKNASGGQSQLKVTGEL